MLEGADRLSRSGLAESDAVRSSEPSVISEVPPERLDPVTPSQLARAVSLRGSEAPSASCGEDPDVATLFVDREAYDSESTGRRSSRNPASAQRRLFAK